MPAKSGESPTNVTTTVTRFCPLVQPETRLDRDFLVVAGLAAADSCIFGDPGHLVLRPVSARLAKPSVGGILGSLHSEESALSFRQRCLRLRHIRPKMRHIRLKILYVGVYFADPN